VENEKIQKVLGSIKAIYLDVSACFICGSFGVAVLKKEN
jgi:hypothetical protein